MCHIDVLTKYKKKRIYVLKMLQHLYSHRHAKALYNFFRLKKQSVGKENILNVLNSDLGCYGCYSVIRFRHHLHVS